MMCANIRMLYEMRWYEGETDQPTYSSVPLFLSTLFYKWMLLLIFQCIYFPTRTYAESKGYTFLHIVHVSLTYVLHEALTNLGIYFCSFSSKRFLPHSHLALCLSISWTEWNDFRPCQTHNFICIPYVALLCVCNVCALCVEYISISFRWSFIFCILCDRPNTTKRKISSQALNAKISRNCLRSCAVVMPTFFNASGNGF